jgi:Na+-translocating ferredoxin:NAD+ oxidoreductase RnfD subunit
MSIGTPQSFAKPPTKPGKVFGIDKRFLAPILITCILLGGQTQFRILGETLWGTALAIVTSIALEIVLGRIATGKWPHLASAYITGISVGILVRSPYLWTYALCSMLSISSKYALRIKDRHLWNPSNLGVSVLLLFIPQAIAPLSQQWGNELAPPIIIMCFGGLILYSLGRLHVTLTYVIAFTILSFVRAGLTEEKWINELALLTAPSYLLFMFFMITDPKSTTRTKTRRCVVAVLVAVTETILRLCRNTHAPYYALFIVAPATNLLEVVWDFFFARRSTVAPQKGQTPASPVPASNGIIPSQGDAVMGVPSK